MKRREHPATCLTTKKRQSIKDIKKICDYVMLSRYLFTMQLI